MTVRDATTGDVAAVVSLETELFGVDAWSEGSVAEELSGPGRLALVAEDGGTVVGYAVVLLGDDLVDLQRIAVAASHRRTGLASRLLGDLQSAARARGANRMLLEVSAANEGALAFYAAHGFVEIDRRRRYYRDGTDAVVLRSSLGTAMCGRRSG